MRRHLMQLIVVLIGVLTNNCFGYLAARINNGPFEIQENGTTDEFTIETILHADIDEYYVIYPNARMDSTWFDVAWYIDGIGGTLLDTASSWNGGLLSHTYSYEYVADLFGMPNSGRFFDAGWIWDSTIGTGTYVDPLTGDSIDTAWWGSHELTMTVLATVPFEPYPNQGDGTILKYYGSAYSTTLTILPASTTTAIPAPSALLLGTIGVGCLTQFRRRKGQ